jgi:hypothetical protein
MKDTEAKWTERVSQWRASGQTAREFAAGREFRSSTLEYWASRLRRTSDEDRPRVGGAVQVQLARVVRAPSRTSSPSIHVHVGGAEVVVSAGFDRQLLRDVVEALGGLR